MENYAFKHTNYKGDNYFSGPKVLGYKYNVFSGSSFRKKNTIRIKKLKKPTNLNKGQILC